MVGWGALPVTLTAALLGAVALGPTVQAGLGSTARQLLAGHPAQLAAPLRVDASTVSTARKRLRLATLPSPPLPAIGSHGGSRAATVTPIPAGTGPLQTLSSFSADSEISQIVAFGSAQAVFTPTPDIAVGPGWVVEVSGSYLGFWPKYGQAAVPSKQVNLDQLLTGSSNSQPGYSVVADAQILFDQIAQRWVLTATVYDPANSNSDVAVAMSYTADPTGDWAVYDLAPYVVSPGQPPTYSYAYLAQRPKVGYSSDAVLVSWNAYSGSSFSGAVLWALDASQLIAATALDNSAYFEGNSESPQFGIAPATSMAASTTAWAAYSQVNSSPNDLVGVISFQGTPSASNYDFAEQDLAVSGLTSPPPAVQPDPTATLATGDSEIQNLVLDQGTLWMDAADSCVPSGDSAARSCVRIISVVVSGAVPTVEQDFDLGTSRAYLYYPALALDGAGDLFVSFGESSSSIYPSSEAVMVPEVELAAGTSPPAQVFQTSVAAGGASYFPSCGTSCEGQGGYLFGAGSGAAIDPQSPGEVWTVSEYATTPGSSCPTASATAGDAGCWSTAIGELGVAGAYTPLPPARILDTRPGSGERGAGQTMGPGEVLQVAVAGEGGVPQQGVSAVVLNVTVTDTTSGGYLSAYPSGAGQPAVSNLNWSVGETVANLVIVPVGSDGELSFYNNVGEADLVVDVEGYFSPASASGSAGTYGPLPPHRIADTRPNSGEPYSGSTLTPGKVLNIKVAGVGGVPATGVTAALLNVTVTDASTSSYLTVFPQGSATPLASNLNWAAGNTVANRVLVPVNPSTGEITVYNQSGTVDVVVDVNGYFSNGSSASVSSDASLFQSVPPTRVLDTRLTGQTLGPGRILSQPLAGVDGIGPAATAVVSNVTAVDTTVGSYFTVYPDDGPGSVRPTASDVNWDTGQIVPNLTVALVGSAGGTDVYNDLGHADLLIDVFGYFSAA